MENMLSSNLKNYSLKYQFVGSIFNLDVHLSHLAWSNKAVCHHTNTIILVEKILLLKNYISNAESLPTLYPYDTKWTFTNSVLTNSPKCIYQLCFATFFMCILDLLLVGPKKDGETCHS